LRWERWRRDGDPRPAPAATMKLLGDWNWYLPRWLRVAAVLRTRRGVGRLRRRRLRSRCSPLRGSRPRLAAAGTPIPSECRGLSARECPVHDLAGSLVRPSCRRYTGRCRPLSRTTRVRRNFAPQSQNAVTNPQPPRFWARLSSSHPEHLQHAERRRGRSSYAAGRGSVGRAQPSLVRALSRQRTWRTVSSCRS
jgi:hypothetical protein